MLRLDRMLVSVLLVLGPALAALPVPASAADDWSMNATVIEACSCPMFCQCYFNPKPSGHGGSGGHDAEHFCRFNNAYKVNKGHWGDTSLDGALFWIAGDLGDDFSDAEMDWAVVTFDKSVSPAQREAINKIVPHLFPVKWKSVSTAEGTISWTADKNAAHALLDGGKTAEVKLTRFQGMTDEPVVIKNLKYWGAPRNDGFVMMPSSFETYRVGDKPFEFKNTNGFMLTLDIDAKTAPPLPESGGGSKSY